MSAASTLVATAPDLAEVVDLWSPAAIARAQAADPGVGPVYRLRIESEQQPPIETLLRDGEKANTYRSQWNFLVVVDGVLYRCFIRPDGSTLRLQLIPPSSLRGELIRLAHTGMSGGHLGYRKTFDQVARRA